MRTGCDVFASPEVVRDSITPLRLGASIAHGPRLSNASVEASQTEELYDETRIDSSCAHDLSRGARGANGLVANAGRGQHPQPKPPADFVGVAGAELESGPAPEPRSGSAAPDSAPAGELRPGRHRQRDGRAHAPCDELCSKAKQHHRQESR